MATWFSVYCLDYCWRHFGGHHRTVGKQVFSDTFTPHSSEWKNQIASQIPCTASSLALPQKRMPFANDIWTTSTDNLFGQRLQRCAEKDHPHCCEEAKISGQPDLFTLSELQIFFFTSRKHLIVTLPIFTRSLALPLALDRVSPSKFGSGLKSIHSRSNGGSQANWTVIR